MKIVKFKDGTYGIRRWRLLWQFFDLRAVDTSIFAFWHERLSPECKGPLEEVKRAYEHLADKGEPLR